MRICVSAFLVTTEPGMRLAGVGRHMFAVLNELTVTDYGHHLEIFIRDDLQLPESWVECKWATWHRIPIHSSKARVWWEHFKIGQEAKRLGCDVILSLFLSLPSFSKIPKVAIAHDAFPRTHPDWYPPRKRVILDQLTALAGRQSNVLVTVSDFSKNELARAYNISSNKIVVAPNGLGNEMRTLSDTELEAIDLEQLKGPNFIFSVGTIEPRKNLDGLIRAFELVKHDPRTSDLKLLIAGAKGWLDSSVGTAWDASPVKDDIEMLGYVSDLELNALMQSAKTFVQPSFVEGFGIPPLEAMTMGTPVVVSNTSSLPEVCGNYAFYCDPTSHESIASAIIESITNDEKRQANIDGGLIRASGFSWYESVKKLENALRIAVN